MVTKPKPKPPPDDPEQSARFVETAKELGSDTGSSAFTRALKKIVPKKRLKNAVIHPKKAT